MRTRVKICGITNIGDARAAVEHGADALGFVMYAQSPRYVSADCAQNIIEQLPPFITCVGLFVNESKANIDAICQQVGFDLLQFHGDETGEFCRQFDKPYIKALRLEKGSDLPRLVDAYPESAGILIDAFVVGMFGGTGVAIDWDQIPALSTPIVLAGGLDAFNVQEAIKKLEPYAVDVSSGLEASKGKKDINKISGFMAAVSIADRDTADRDRLNTSKA